MKYIFSDNHEIGEVGKLPIKDIQIAWYDMEKDSHCFDEDFIAPENFSVKDLMYISTEDDEDDLDKARIFVHLFDGRCYELLLKKVNDRGVGYFYDS